MGFPHQFHLVIKYKKDTSNKVVDMLSSHPISASIVLKKDSLSFEIYVEQYVNDDEFNEIYAKLTHGSQVENCTCNVNCCITLVNCAYPQEKV